MREDISSIRGEQQAMLSNVKEIYRTLDSLEDGQKAIRRTVARINRKIDHLGDDLAEVLTGLTDAADAALKQAK